MTLKKITGIMVCDSEGAIARQGKMPWYYPNSGDIQFFRKKTVGEVMIMGRKTYDTLPKKTYQETIKIVLTSKQVEENQKYTYWVNDLDDIKIMLSKFADKRIYMIGGLKTAELFLNADLISEFFLTKLNKSYNGDLFLPLDFLSGWVKEVVETNSEYTIYKYLSNINSKEPI